MCPRHFEDSCAVITKRVAYSILSGLLEEDGEARGTKVTSRTPVRKEAWK